VKFKEEFNTEGTRKLKYLQSDQKCFHLKL
jgi:hypothetical protein